MGIVKDRLQTTVTHSWTQMSASYSYVGPPAAKAGTIINGAYKPDLFAIRTVNAATANVAH